MKNGIHFRNLDRTNNLVLVENTEAGDGNTADYFYTPERDLDSPAAESSPTPTAIVVFLSVSLACAVTAIATGSYAAWLVRQRMARQALTDVNDILKSCQARMQQLEADVQRLPRY